MVQGRCPEEVVPGRTFRVSLLTVVFSSAMVLALLVKGRIQAIVYIKRDVAPIDIFP
jgi:hypothetical protein